MTLSYGSPYYLIEYVGKDGRRTDLSKFVTRFEYTHAEAEDDTCRLSLKLLSPDTLDSPAFDYRSEWSVKWGYIDGVSHSEKVYLEEVNPQFEADGLSVNITLHDKYSIAKKQGSRGIVGENTPLPTALHNVAKPIGVKAMISTELLSKQDEQNPNNLSITGRKTVINVNTANTEDFSRAMRKQRAVDQVKKFVEIEPGKKVDMYDAYPALERLAAEVPGTKNLIETDQIHDEKDLRDYLYLRSRPMPMAGKSKAQVIKELAKKYGIVQPVVVTGHSDKVYLKAKNTNLPPSKFFEYGGADGLLISFSPETRHKNLQADATSQITSSWDAMNKTALLTNLTKEANDKLNGAAKEQSSLQSRDGYVRIAPKGAEGPDGTISSLGFFERGSNVGLQGLFYNGSGGVTAVDNTAPPRLTNIRLVQPDPIQESRAVITPQEIASAINMGGQNITRAEYNITPGTFAMMGDPEVLSGMVINFKGVSKRYNGNYYVVKAVHLVESSGGYMVSGELIKSNEPGKYSIKQKKKNYKKSRINYNP